MRARAARGVRCLVLAVSTLLAWPALAQELPVRSVRVAQRSGRLVASFEMAELFDTAVRRRLRSGIPSQVVVRAYVYRDGGGSSLGLGAQTCRAVYDLWEEVFTLAVAGAGTERRWQSGRDQDVINACARIEALPVVRLTELDARARYRVAVLAELNPISQRTLASIRRWLAHPGGTSQSERAGLFGSFASIFVNRRIGAAEKTVRFQSRPFRIVAE